MPFTLNPATHADRAAAENAVFGRALNDWEYADLAGDVLGDGTLNIAYNEPWGKINGTARIRIQCVGQLGKIIVRMIPGRFEFCSFNAKKPKQGYGTLVLYRIARAAMDRGFARITAEGEKHANAQGQLTSWGYYSFPRLGFDALIPAATPARPAALAAHTRLSQLLSTQAGRDFWWDHGVQVPVMEFDLANNSASWQTLLARF